MPASNVFQIFYTISVMTLCSFFQCKYLYLHIRRLHQDREPPFFAIRLRKCTTFQAHVGSLSRYQTDSGVYHEENSLSPTQRCGYNQLQTQTNILKIQRYQGIKAIYCLSQRMILFLRWKLYSEQIVFLHHCQFYRKRACNIIFQALVVEQNKHTASIILILQLCPQNQILYSQGMLLVCVCVSKVQL